MHNVKSVVKKLKLLGNSKGKEAIARYGITPEEAFCVSIPNLRELAKEIGKDHKLALELWDLGIRETRILASMIDEVSLVTVKQMEEWTKGFTYWEICDQCCMNLFEKHETSYVLAEKWSKKKEEGIKRAGFVLMARLAVSDKKADDKRFEKFLPMIKREAVDERHLVKKAVNWALRQIGKRSMALHKTAVLLAQEIAEIDSKSARWVANDALRELENDKTIKRIKR
ncbi:MAG: DNA alkylation repair protein [Waddliaceae bacterium]|jgi:3-methyladenine DNA glycosylase AlkD|nr:DNA alkylation repair protein [Waddliaceae bacterium]MBT3579507.1 DNA alkylation repair protein [Waddliaceae bacterium]MBT4444506.1 DNA alkylation repair protein [Waddliaceae bacterium]MBT6929193.1 DNA alkylation repair protein [Waddliaceae bacterium]MBT7264071.1 DNA alkylation repair protein [Waddliaceae bacterium]